MCPELIRGVDYDTKVDVWSMGITTIEIIDGEPPLMNELPMRAMLLITTNPSPAPQNADRCSSLLKHFVKSAVMTDPHLRASTAQMLMHPLLEDIASREDFAAFAKHRFDLKNDMKKTDAQWWR
jgi:serine/threonine protein kinase